VSRLEEIAVRYQRNRHYLSDRTEDNLGWLIARVRTLETAALDAHNALDHLDDLAMTSAQRRKANHQIAESLRRVLKENI